MRLSFSLIPRMSVSNPGGPMEEVYEVEPVYAPHPPDTPLRLFSLEMTFPDSPSRHHFAAPTKTGAYLLETTFPDSPSRHHFAAPTKTGAYPLETTFPDTTSRLRPKLEPIH